MISAVALAFAYKSAIDRKAKKHERMIEAHNNSNMSYRNNINQGHLGDSIESISRNREYGNTNPFWGANG